MKTAAKSIGIHAHLNGKKCRTLLLGCAIGVISCTSFAAAEIDGFGRAVGRIWGCGGAMDKGDLADVVKSLSVSRDTLLQHDQNIQESYTAAWYIYAEMQFYTFSKTGSNVTKEDCIKYIVGSGDSEDSNSAMQLATTIVRDFPQTKYARAAFELSEAIVAFMRERYSVAVPSLRKDGCHKKIRGWDNAIRRDDLVTFDTEFRLDLADQIVVSKSGYLKSQYENVRTNLQRVASQKKAGDAEWYFDFCKYDDERREYLNMLSEQKMIAHGDSQNGMIKGVYGIPLGQKIDEMKGKVSDYISPMGNVDLTLNDPAKPFGYCVACRIHPNTRKVCSYSLSGASQGDLFEIISHLEKEYARKFKQIGKYRWQLRVGTRRINITHAVRFGNDIHCFVVDDELQWEADRAWEIRRNTELKAEKPVSQN